MPIENYKGVAASNQYKETKYYTINALEPFQCIRENPWESVIFKPLRYLLFMHPLAKLKIYVSFDILYN